jgi:hypothetical protein
LVDQRHAGWQNRAHFFAVASEMMRRILVDHARRRKMAKRSGGWVRVTLDAAVAREDPPDVDLLDLDAALTDLASDLGRWPSSVSSVGSPSTGRRRAVRARPPSRWQVARAWLHV